MEVRNPAVSRVARPPNRASNMDRTGCLTDLAADPDASRVDSVTERVVERRFAHGIVFLTGKGRKERS